MHGDDLKALCEVSDEGVTLVLDEFYSQYIYDLGDGATVTAARYVKDVNKDSIILIDGLTKNYRYPGFRVAWVSLSQLHRTTDILMLQGDRS